MIHVFSRWAGVGASTSGAMKLKFLVETIFARISKALGQGSRCGKVVFGRYSADSYLKHHIDTLYLVWQVFAFFSDIVGRFLLLLPVQSTATSLRACENRSLFFQLNSCLPRSSTADWNITTIRFLLLRLRLEPSATDPESTVVVEVPVDSGEGVRTVKDLTMWEQLSFAAFLQWYWADNQARKSLLDYETTKQRFVKCLGEIHPWLSMPRCVHRWNFVSHRWVGSLQKCFLAQIWTGCWCRGKLKLDTRYTFSFYAINISIFWTTARRKAPESRTVTFDGNLSRCDQYLLNPPQSSNPLGSASRTEEFFHVAYS